MKEIVILEFVINLIILLIFYMHMFQLNSYSWKKHMHWMKKNKKKIIIQILLAIIPMVLITFKNFIFDILSILFLGFSIFYNFPKSRTKIPLEITNRVKRMFCSELIIIFIVILINNINNYIILKLFILNVLCSIMCVIANFINSPIEYWRKKQYIKQAKKIIQDMPNLTVIGVTGSYGKTSVKTFLEKTLSKKYEVLVTPKNYNTTMGVVKTIRESLKSTHQIFICEMGATKTGDIKEICDIVKPKIGIITAIGPQHLETFKTIDNVIKTKFELADAVKKLNGVMFLNYDNEYLYKNDLNMKTISYGINNETLDYNAYELVSSSKGLSFKTLDKKNKEVEFKTKLIGKHNVINMMAAIAVANYLDVSIAGLVPIIRDIKSVNHRLELISHGDLTIIDDSYNSNPISSKSALDTLAEFDGVKIIITPGLIELGENENKYNFELGQNITKICDYIFLVGEEHSKPVLDGIKSKKFDKSRIFIVNTPQEAMKKISDLNIKGKVTVLLENDLPDNYNL